MWIQWRSRYSLAKCVTRSSYVKMWRKIVSRVSVWPWLFWSKFPLKGRYIWSSSWRRSLFCEDRGYREREIVFSPKIAVKGWVADTFWCWRILVRWLIRHLRCLLQSWGEGDHVNPVKFEMHARQWRSKGRHWGSRALPKICRTLLRAPLIKFVVSKTIMDFSKLKPVGCIILSYLLDQIIRHWIFSWGPFIHARFYRLRLSAWCMQKVLDIPYIKISTFDSSQFLVDALVSLLHTPSCQSQGKKSQL